LTHGVGLPTGTTILKYNFVADYTNEASKYFGWSTKNMF